MCTLAFFGGVINHIIGVYTICDHRLCLSTSAPAYCEAPGDVADVVIAVDDTAVGSTATYQCTDGYEPSDVRVTVCTAMGVWAPDPATLECTKPGWYMNT